MLHPGIKGQERIQSELLTLPVDVAYTPGRGRLKQKQGSSENNLPEDPVGMELLSSSPP